MVSTHTVPCELCVFQVFFLPLSNTIITCFKDDSIFAWDSETLQCKYQLPVPPDKQPHYRTLSTPRDGRTLVAGGRCGQFCKLAQIWTNTSCLNNFEKLLFLLNIALSLCFSPGYTSNMCMYPANKLNQCC